MKKLTVTNLSLGLFGLLVAAFAIFLIDRGSDQSWPSITNNKPSGFMAFAELLRRDGYSVSMNRSAAPKIATDALAICPAFVQTETEVDAIMAGRFGMSPQGPTPLETALADHAKNGGTLLYIPVPLWFDDQSKEIKLGQDVQGPSKEIKGKASYVDPSRLEEGRPEWSEGDTQVKFWQTPGQILLTGTAVIGRGRIGLVGDGMMVSNRHLDEDDNAKILLGLVRRLAKPGSQVIFVESTFGNVEEQGLFAAIGPWASAARWQAIVLLLVVVFTLGRRFGLAEVEHPIERGARDMLVALSVTLRTNKRSQLALETIADEAVERARRVLRLPPSTSEKDILARVPEELALAVRNVRLRSMATKPPAPLDAARTVQSALRAFEQDSRTRGSRP